MDKNDDAASVENVLGPTRPHLSKSSTAFSQSLDAPSRTREPAVLLKFPESDEKKS